MIWIADGSLADLQDARTESHARAVKESRRSRSRREAAQHEVVCDVCGETFATSSQTAKRHSAKDLTHDCYFRWESARQRAKARK